MGTYIRFLKPLEKRLKIEKRGPTITVAGRAGVGKSTVAAFIAKDLGLENVSAGEIFRKIAAERGLPLEEFSRTREREVDHEIERRTLERAMSGGVVIDGRLAGWAAGNWSDCNIYLECGIATRAERVAKREDVPVDEARKSIIGRDAEDNKKYASLYGLKMDDRTIYDIVVDTDGYGSIPSMQHAIMRMVAAFLEKPSSDRKHRR